MAKRNQKEDPNGLAIDRTGWPAFDPSANVKALVESNKASADLLRQADTKYNDAMHRHLREIGELRAKNAEIQRVGDLKSADTLRVGDLDRLDKTRQVDVMAATASAQQLATAVQTLANTSDRNAETLRNLVNATAATMAKQTADQAQVLSTQTDNLVKGINDRIAELQKAQYQGVGRSSVSDPAMEALIVEVKKLSTAGSASTGRTDGINWIIVTLFGVITIAIALYAALKPH